MDGYTSDIAELDRLDEENRLNDLDFADESSLSDMEGHIRELQNFLQPNQHNGDVKDSNVHSEDLDESDVSVFANRLPNSRSVADRYAVTLSSSIEKDSMKDLLIPGRALSLEDEVVRLTKEVQTKNAEMHAQKLHINHLALQVKALTDREAEQRAQCESARLAHATAEQDKILLEVKDSPSPIWSSSDQSIVCRRD